MTTQNLQLRLSNPPYGRYEIKALCADASAEIDRLNGLLGQTRTDHSAEIAALRAENDKLRKDKSLDAWIETIGDENSRLIAMWQDRAQKAGFEIKRLRAALERMQKELHEPIANTNTIIRLD